MIYFTLFLAGLLVGSFLNTCISRIPANESILFPPSRCSHCKTGLRPRDLIPVLSWLFLRGRCRYCGEPIARQYPVIELVNGILYLTIYAVHGLSAQSFFYLFLASLLLVMAVIDRHHQVIPDGLNLAGLLGGGIFTVFVPGGAGLVNGLAGLLLGGGLFFLIAVITQGAMGGGDIKLMGVLGLWLGWKQVLLTAFFAFILGSIISLALLAAGKVKRKDPLPFGPFISMSAVLVMLWGEQILAWYLQMVF